MDIYKKIAKAKKEIKNTKMKKVGRNNFSKYDYFAPDQVEQLVFEACDNNELLTVFNLDRNEFGEIGMLKVIDINNGDTQEYIMATAIPEMKATNVSQQLGGCVTYTERYLKMSVFGIVDNSLDFDTDQKKPKKEPVKKTSKLVELNPEYKGWKAAKDALKEDKTTIEKLKKAYILSPENEKLILA